MSIFVYVLGGLVGIFLLFILMQQLLIRKMQKLKGTPAPELSGREGKVIQKGQRAIFYFYSPQCNACRAITPIIDEMQKKNPRIFKINLAEDREIAMKFGIMATPTTVLIENKMITELLIGPQKKEVLMSLLKR